MLLNMYSIYDKLAKEFGPVFQAKNHNVARRAFFQEIPEVYKNRLNDYELKFIGSFDNENGFLAAEPFPQVIGFEEAIEEEVKNA